VRTRPVQAAQVEWLSSESVARHYLTGTAAALHSAQCLATIGLPRRWRGLPRFTLLEAGFGLGHHFLHTWRAWKQEALGEPPTERQLTYVAVEKYPPILADLRRAHALDERIEPLAQALLDAWPPLTPNIHVLDFDGGRVRLLLALGDVDPMLASLQVRADAVLIDGLGQARGSFAVSQRMATALARVVAPEATLLATSLGEDARLFAAQLKTAGFELQPAVGNDIGNDDVTSTLLARFNPSFKARRVPVRKAMLQNRVESAPRTALVIGGGLAGALAAQALARSGWCCTVIDRHPQPAQEASGNPAGLFHGTAHAGDGVHARFNRAAALLAAQRYAPLVHAAAIQGQVQGVLRLNATELAAASGMKGYLDVLNADEATQVAGCPVQGPAWLFSGGGWLSPASLCRQALSTPGVLWQGGAAVERLLAKDGGWCALGADGRTLAQAQIVVCATGAAPVPYPVVETGCAGLGDVSKDRQAQGLSPGEGEWPVSAEWPLQRIRGQVSWLKARDVEAVAGMHKSDVSLGPARPLSGNGYALRTADGSLLFGASAQPDDDEANVRDSDHAHNLERLASLCGLKAKSAAAVQGRVGWRATMPDRLPLVGAWPMCVEQIEATTRLDHCRLVPRTPGLYVLLGLASRGLTWGPLAAEVLAAWINGTAMPIESDLLDAIDPARTRVRQVRRSQQSN
jgi:tRNA 5-methylaminomethyl-2-thiouridine biosynthesis bifunctional protein